jgi:hypothetical protein
VRGMRGLIISLLFVGCTGGLTPSPVPYRTVAIPIESSSLTPVEALGYDLYLRDIVASRSTDVALAAVDMQALGVQGWIVVERNERYLARFVNEFEEAVVDVGVDPFSEAAPTLVIKSPPEHLDERELAMWRARQLAGRQPFSECSDRYNSVVLPVSDSPSSDWYVYLLASTLDSSKIMLGGHHRYRVDRQGFEVLEHLAMTKSCVFSTYDESMIAVTVSHIVTDKPLESHVYLNHLHGISIGVVVIDTGEVFVVENGRIRLLPEQ